MDFSKCRRVEGIKAADVQYPGTRCKTIEATKMADNLGERSFDDLLVRHINCPRKGSAGIGGNRCRPLDVECSDASACISQQLCRRGSYTARSSGDRDNLTRYAACHGRRLPSTRT